MGIRVTDRSRHSVQDRDGNLTTSADTNPSYQDNGLDWLAHTTNHEWWMPSVVNTTTQPFPSFIPYRIAQDQHTPELDTLLRVRLQLVQSTPFMYHLQGNVVKLTAVSTHRLGHLVLKHK